MVGIVILNYMNWEVTYNCIKSIYDTENIVYHIYLVDNASPNPPPNDFLKFIDNSKITFIRSIENRGYAAGNNIGIKAALKDRCENILISNSDIIFTNNSIGLLHKYLKENSDTGIVGPKTLNIDGSIICCVSRKTKIIDILFANSELSVFFKKFKRKYYCLDRDYSKTFDAYYVSGGCFMMSYDCASDIAPFDENTFLYYEELIIGIKMEQKGYKTTYYPQSIVIHDHGQSTKNIRALSSIIFKESELYYCSKYLKASVIQILPLYFIRTISYLIRCLQYKDYRDNIVLYFRNTLQRLFIKY